mmetsp:Transcript_24879/g.37808  ORF Transcript_24879/g.37808 Transcript_24879/m.37808 type:complete len:154 (+) Transcript_24879:95-556(+)
MSATDGLLPEELAEYKDAFDMFDIDKGGTIESHELQCVMARLGEVLTDKELADMMKSLDSNGDGVIDFDEFVTMMKKRAKERMNEDPEIQLRAVFNKFDADNSGRIDRNEVRMIMKKLAQSLTDEEITSIIDIADLDGDGEISWDEFKTIMFC